MNIGSSLLPFCFATSASTAFLRFRSRLVFPFGSSGWRRGFKSPVGLVRLFKDLTDDGIVDLVVAMILSVSTFLIPDDLKKDQHLGCIVAGQFHTEICAPSLSEGSEHVFQIVEIVFSAFQDIEGAGIDIFKSRGCFSFILGH